MKPTRSALAAQLAAAQAHNNRLKNVGAEMANMCANGRHVTDVPQHYREQMALLVERWDAAVKHEGGKA